MRSSCIYRWASVVFAALAVVACTKANPGFIGGDSAVRLDGGVADGPSGDGSPAPDGAADAGGDASVGCLRDEQCTTNLPCTRGFCDEGRCLARVEPGFCVLEGSCVADGALNPQNRCRLCDAGNPTAWTARGDGQACDEDGLSCTLDACRGGQCQHEVVEGCLVDGVCIAEGAALGPGACLECIHQASSSDLTFVDGKPCIAAPGGVGGMCVTDGCRGWASATYEPPLRLPDGQFLSATQLNAVDHVDLADGGAGEVWAGGEVTTKGNLGTQRGGFVVRLDGPSAGVAGLFSSPVVDLSHRLAIVQPGQGYLLVGNGWVWSADLDDHMDGLERFGVWGSRSSEGEAFYLTGRQDTDENSAFGVVRCELFDQDRLACRDQDGVDQGQRLGPVVGTIEDGRQGRLWALSAASPDHIYTNSGSDDAWSRAAEDGGCTDHGNTLATPCSATSGRFRSIYAASAGSVWAVGEDGLILSYDGKLWRRVSQVISSQSRYDFDGVFVAGDLVTIVGHRDALTSRRIVLVRFNGALNRWFEPIQIDIVTPSSSAQILHIGGRDYGSVWMVGYRPSPAVDRPAGWVLNLR